MTDKWTIDPEEQITDPMWERELIEKVSMASIEESRRGRRWGIFFKILMFLYLGVLLFLLLPFDITDTVKPKEKHTALIDVTGVIAADADASADKIVTGLRNAFEDENTKGVILRINSPGGSPVQSGYVYDEIMRLKKKYPEIPVYAVVADICASGGYYIAAAADKIYADKSSIVGSIGVLMSSFGFVEGMKELGVERRLMTAGTNKGILDPFSPSSERHKIHIQGMLDQLHRQFIKAVKDGRGDRLKETDDTFSGLFWSGEESVKLGLVDGLGSSGYVARELIEAEDIVDFTAKQDVYERLIERLGVSVAETLARVSGINQAPELR